MGQLLLDTDVHTATVVETCTVGTVRYLRYVTGEMFWHFFPSHGYRDTGLGYVSRVFRVPSII